MVRSWRMRDGAGVSLLTMIPGPRENLIVTISLFVPRTDTGVPR